MAGGITPTEAMRVLTTHRHQPMGPPISTVHAANAAKLKDVLLVAAVAALEAAVAVLVVIVGRVRRVATHSPQ